VRVCVCMSVREFVRECVGKSVCERERVWESVFERECVRERV
jgi:hypothetical protein